MSPYVVEAGVRQEPAHVVVGKAEPDVAHLLTVFLVVVRRHVAMSRRPPGLRTRGAQRVGDGNGAAPASSAASRLDESIGSAACPSAG